MDKVLVNISQQSKYAEIDPIYDFNDIKEQKLR